MYIEDILFKLINFPKIISPHDFNIFNNLNTQIISGIGWTEKQGNLILTLLKKYKDKINTAYNYDINNFLLNPKFKNSFRSINYGKKIKIINHEHYNRIISVEFPYDNDLLTIFKEKKQELNTVVWDKDTKSWFFSLDEKSIKFLSKLVVDHNFTPDDEFEDYIKQLDIIEKNIENIVPMAILENDQLKFINIPPYAPQNTSTDFLESIFFAKKIGINVWDNNVEEKIVNLPYDDVTKQLIKHEPGNHFEIKLDECTLDVLSPVLNYMVPLLVIIGSNNQIDRLTSMVECFNKIGIKNNEMTVLFRLPSDKGGDFNNYVKNHGLNSKCSKNSKVIFIGDHIPKTILSTGIDFNGILNYNYYAAHYRIKNYINWHHNVINILDNRSQRSINFAFL